MKTYDAYLFDMDGTVTQSFVAWIEIVQATLDDYHIAADKKVIIRKIFGNARAGLIELGVPESDLPEVFKEWDDKAAKRMLSLELYPDVATILARLKQQGKKLALITATPRSTLDVILDATQLRDTFDLTLAGTEIKAQKPNPESLLLALDRLSVTKDRAVMLGDSEKDIRAAHNAGVDSVLFYPPEHDDFHNLADLQADNPTYTIKAWRELIDAVQ